MPKTRNRSALDTIIIPTSQVVPFQGVPLPVPVENEDQERILTKVLNMDGFVVISPVKDPSKGLFVENLSGVGVFAKVLRIIDLPDGAKSAFLACEQAVEVFPDDNRDKNFFYGNFVARPDKVRKTKREEYLMMLKLVERLYDELKEFFLENTNVHLAAPKEITDDPEIYLNFLIVTSPIPYDKKLDMALEQDLYKRGEKALMALDQIKREIDLRREIFTKASMEMDREQRNHLLRAQMRTIQNEIGEGEEEDIVRLEERADLMNWSPETAEAFRKELGKLRRYNPTSPDYALQYTYLEMLLSLPWNNVSEAEIDLVKLRKDLEKDHYGLEKIKERIIEHIAVLKLRGDMRSPILCLYGAPGVGKTSLCKSIADSIGREYARISLGGLHDETQLRGHRRTYIGALPGRIITSLSKLKTNNPVFVLDEIDKIGHDHRGDPAQALLEVLDPEQNSRFHDNYLDIDYDLSKVFFIATANDISTISAPLRDRMELIDISGYILEEKLEIAKRHLIPKLLENHGFAKKEVQFTDGAIRAAIENYTRESGVRALEKVLAKVLRKIAVKKVSGSPFPKKINEKELRSLLGKEDVMKEVYETDLPVGVVSGLAWTPVGGEILYFESSLSEGKGNITLTGNLGDVMKESATLALQWIKANAASLDIDPSCFPKTDVHLHVPEGAVPKDGPSAGITMVTSMVSAFTDRPLKGSLAMTGEVTLRGKVLPVGGIKEKILAAKRAGISTIILSEKNRPDIEDIPAKYTSGLTFLYASTIPEVLNLALAPK